MDPEPGEGNTHPAQSAVAITQLQWTVMDGHREKDKQAESADPRQSALESEVAALIAEAVNLEKPAAELDPAIPLFGDGLGLDSIDVLEIALAVSRKYGFQLRSDDPGNRRIFASLRSLSA